MPGREVRNILFIRECHFGNAQNRYRGAAPEVTSLYVTV
jgi:hypothetical protein